MCVCLLNRLASIRLFAYVQESTQKFRPNYGEVAFKLVPSYAYTRRLTTALHSEPGGLKSSPPELAKLDTVVL